MKRLINDLASSKTNRLCEFISNGAWTFPQPVSNELSIIANNLPPLHNNEGGLLVVPDTLLLLQLGRKVLMSLGQIWCGFCAEICNY